MRGFRDEEEELELDEDEQYAQETSGYYDEEDDEQALWDGDTFLGEEEAESLQIDEDEEY